MSNVVGVGQISLMDLNDAIIAGIPPSNPTVGTLWIDESQDPPMLKKWNGEAWIDLGELDPNLSVVIEEINETLGNMANDNLINFQERQVIKDKLTEIIGYVITDTVTTLPTVSTLDNSGKGSFWSVRKSARNVGISTSDTTYVNVATKYNNLKSYLESLTPIVPWDTRNANADVVVSVTKSTFRDMWLQYYLAVDALAELTAQKIKENNDELKDDVDVIGRDLDSLTGRVTNVESKVTDESIVNTVTRSEAWVEQINVINDKVSKTEFENLQIGGRNLLTGTKDELTYVNVSGWADYQDDNTNYTDLVNILQPDETYTLRVFLDARNSDYPVGVRIRLPNETNPHRDFQGNWIEAGEQGYSTVTFVMPSDATSSRIFMIRFNQKDTPTQNVGYGKAKLERGNKATDWTPAPEDIEDSIDILTTKINNVEQEITADKIVTTITESTTFQNILDSKADTDSLGDFATKDELGELSEDVDGRIDTAIQGIDFEPYATKLELEETSRAITAKFSATGGLNLIRNSIGFADLDFWDDAHNLFRNSTFDDGMTHWRLFNNTPTSLVDVVNGVMIINPNPNGSPITSVGQTISGRKEVDYIVKLYARGRGRMSVRWGNQDRNYINLTDSFEWYTFKTNATGGNSNIIMEVIDDTVEIRKAIILEGSDINTISPSTVSNAELDRLGFGSGFYFPAGNQNGITQSVPVVAGQPYTLSWYANKYSSSSSNGRLLIQINDNGEIITLKEYSSNETTTRYEHDSATYIPSSNVVQIRVVSESNTEATITGLMFNIGDVPLQWSLSTGEVYNTNIRMDINGIRVSQLNEDRREIGYTQITPDEFAGYYDSDGNGTFEKVFYLNGEETVTKKFRALNEITMGGIKVVNINSGGRNGWAFVPIVEE